MRKFMPVLAVLFLAGLVSATTCSWDMLDDSLSDNSTGWANYQAGAQGYCQTHCTNTFSSGTMSYYCNADSTANEACYMSANISAGAPKTILVRFRNLLYTIVDIPSVQEGFQFHVNGTILNRYDGVNHSIWLDNNFSSENSNATWTDWNIILLHIYDTNATADSIDVTFNGVDKGLIVNTTATFAAVSKFMIRGNMIDTSYSNGTVELDYVKISSTENCTQCDANSGCDYGDYCSEGICVNTTECDADDDCFGLGFGYYCNDNSHCALEGFCEVDDECQTDEYCDVFSASFYHTCKDKRNLTEACTHDNQCFQAECINESESTNSCNPLEINECWPTGVCELDNVCWNYGMCYNVTADNYCDADADCDDDEFCNVWVDGEGNGICLDKLKLAWDSCERDGWCDNTTNNTYNVNLSCIDDFCTPTDWECNWFGLGCGTGEACNWSTQAEIGDHLCVNGSAGIVCDGDNNCSEGLYCLAGTCVYNSTKCLYNNPDVLGNSNPNKEPDGYCDKVGSNESSEWCYNDGLNYTLTAGSGGGLPLSADKDCWRKFGFSVKCDYDYQCFSLNCDFSGNTSAKTCNPFVGGTTENSTVTFNIDNCEPSSNGLGWDCPVNDTAVITARYRDANGIHISDADFCRAYSDAFYVSNPTLHENPTSYFAPVSFNNNTNINYTILVECRKSGVGSTSSDIKWIYLKAVNTTFVSWDAPRTNNTVFKAGKAVDFRVFFKDITGASLNGGTCTFTLDGSDYTMENPSGGIYISRDINVPTGSGGYDYTATCTKSGYASDTSPSHSLTVLQSHCFNGDKDEDETGEDCGGGDCAPCGDPPNQQDCFNDRLDACEWGVDCGGCCAKVCVWSDCFNKVQDGGESGVDCGGFCYMDCDTGSCSNGIKDGDEKGIDCGGRCYQMDDSYGACFCDYTNDCDPYDGSWYCDYDRFDVTGLCLESTCDADDDCDDVYWDFGGVAANRTRVCDSNSGWCKWGNSSYNNGTTAAIVLDIKALSGLPRYNNTFVGTCEDLTHGFRIATSVPTKKGYYFVTHPDTKSIPADVIIGPYPFKDFDMGRVTNLSLSTIPKLCRSITDESIFARIVLKAVEPSTTKFNSDVVDIQVYAFAFASNVSMSELGINTADFNLTREGECFVRGDPYSNWTNISAAASTTHSYNFSTISSRRFYWMCNTTQGELDEGTFHAGGFTIFFDLLGGVFLGLTGGVFTWRGWMIIPVFIILVIFVPLLYLATKEGRRRNDGR